jgi:CRISPR-associated protein Csb2
MTTLGIRYLTGCSVATNLAIPRRPEWPPHPGRVFMAMAATYFETRGEESEREALEWLENAGAPAVSASDHQPRSFVETYVPVNDTLDKDSGAAFRKRQPRSFPTCRPDQDSVYLIWGSDVPEHLRGGLERLCSKVTRIGHSSSLVQMWVADRASRVDAEWRPSGGTVGQQMRVAEPGTLAYLKRAFNQEAIERYQRLSEAMDVARGKEKTKIRKEMAELFPEGQPTAARPKLPRWQGYARSTRKTEDSPVGHGPFDPELIILRRNDESRVLGLEATLQLTSALRDAAMKAAGENVPEWLSGHQPDGKPAQRPHAAFFPLPFVGAKYADGHVMGLAIAIPRDLHLQGESRDEALRRIIGSLLFHETSGEEKTVNLWRGDAWEWKLEREKRDYPPLTLRAKTWTGPEQHWASVTPVVLHHYPKRKRDGDVERILLQAFESARLPAPVEMRVQPVSFFEGAGHARSVPQFTEGGENLCRYQVHVAVKFPFSVGGPVLVGRGRFRGYGLFRPVR